MEENLPSQSKDNYLKALNDLMNYAATNGEQPSEADYISYIHRRPKKKFKYKFIWSPLYSTINAVSQMKYRIKVQNNPQIKIISNSH